MMSEVYRHNQFTIEMVEQVEIEGVSLDQFDAPQLRQMVFELLRTLQRREENELMRTEVEKAA